MSDREKIADEIERHIAGFFTRDGMTEAAINAFAQCVMDNRETVLAALRSQGREDGAREMREASLPKAVVFRQLTDDERRDGAEALARAYRDERTAAHGNTAPWPAGCLKPNSCARHRRCMYGPNPLALRIGVWRAGPIWRNWRRLTSCAALTLSKIGRAHV